MWWSSFAAAQVPTAPGEPVTIAADPAPVRVTGYFLPRHDPAWITDEAPTRSCTVAVRLAPDGALEVTPRTCPEPMPAAMVAATRAWTFGPVDAPTTFEVRYVVTYSELIAAMMLHAEVDPGEERAFAGDRGSPGLRLVHPARLVASKPARAKGVAPARCTLRLTIDGNGRVARWEPLDCPVALRPAAQKALRRWRYTPRIEDAMTMPERVDVEVPFRDR